jgi:hypothetical protein
LLQRVSWLRSTAHLEYPMSFSYIKKLPGLSKNQDFFIVFPRLWSGKPTPSGAVFSPRGVVLATPLEPTIRHRPLHHLQKRKENPAIQWRVVPPRNMEHISKIPRHLNRSGIWNKFRRPLHYFLNIIRLPKNSKLVFFKNRLNPLLSKQFYISLRSLPIVYRDSGSL